MGNHGFCVFVGFGSCGHVSTHMATAMVVAMAIPIAISMGVAMAMEIAMAMSMGHGDGILALKHRPPTLQLHTQVLHSGKNKRYTKPMALVDPNDGRRTHLSIAGTQCADS